MHSKSLLLGAAVALLAAAPAHAGTVIVKLGANASQHKLVQAGAGRTVARIAGTGARLLQVSGDPAAVAARLAHTRGVRWAEPNFGVRALGAPNDAQWRALYGVQRVGAPAFWEAHGLGGFHFICSSAGENRPLTGVEMRIILQHSDCGFDRIKTRSPALQNIAAGAERIFKSSAILLFALRRHFASLDRAGIDASHEDLAGKVRACGAAQDGVVTDGDCADGEGHGTHVAGTIAALANNRAGVAGVAFNSPLIVCRALGGPDGSGTVADVAACIRWTHDRGAKVISMSLGGPSSHTLAEAAKSAYARGGRSGSLLVAAAGNDGDGTVEYPAGLEQVVSVAAVDDRDGVAPFSNENADVEIAAPGVDILSTRLGGGYVRLSGTSMATPHVAGAAALLWGLRPSVTAGTIRRRLDAAVDDRGAPGRDPAYGFGVVDLATS